MRQADVAKIALSDRNRVRIYKGDVLYNVGDPIRAVYAVRVGTFKTRVTIEDGRSQVLGFRLPGEILGIDSLMQPTHGTAAIALEDSSLCMISSETLRFWLADIPALRQRLLLALLQETHQDRTLLTMLGLMSADERMAGFLLSLSDRFAARGFAASEFMLRMTREDIGSYLGLKLETVSRVLSRLAGAGIIEVRSRHIEILDRAALRRRYHGQASIPPMVMESNNTLPRIPAGHVSPR